MDKCLCLGFYREVQSELKTKTTNESQQVFVKEKTEITFEVLVPKEVEVQQNKKQIREVSLYGTRQQT
jgi:hypothetical protein